MRIRQRTRFNCVRVSNGLDSQPMMSCSSTSAIGWLRALATMDGDAIANEAPASSVDVRSNLLPQLSKQIHTDFVNQHSTRIHSLHAFQN
jgi:hypothetical protein